MKKKAEKSCRIVTFYSYKGGTGRTMAMANMAWILASAGKRVLAIDWDLEAPGLHRYLHPFLPDREVASSPGLIDFFWEFVLKARDEKIDHSGTWYLPYADLLRYALPIEWDFPGEGVLHMVSAGRQDADYPRLVAQFDWSGFYDRMRGGVLLEVVKEQLRERYDYVLIDSRTGLSDTSGICAVQMPDDLVCCFTMNSQNILGTAGVTDSAWKQRFKPNGEPGLTIWPLPTRVEPAERDRLERARTFSRQRFSRYLKHLPRAEQDTYWRRVEVPYMAYYAYEEVLATFRDAPQHPTGSVLYPIEELTRYVTREEVSRMERIPEKLRRETLDRFTREVVARNLVIWVEGVGQTAVQLVARIEAELLRDNPMVSVMNVSGQREDELSFRAIEKQLDLAVVAVPADSGMRPLTALVTRVQPLLRKLGLMTQVDVVMISEQNFEADMRRLSVQIKGLSQEPVDTVDDPEDPQKGRWGGTPSRNGRKLSAKVKRITSDWFEIGLELKASGGKPLAGHATFFLHPTFQPEYRRVPVIDGKATLTIQAWGAFTVGVVCDDGMTRLELNLAELAGADPVFRSR